MTVAERLIERHTFSTPEFSAKDEKGKIVTLCCYTFDFLEEDSPIRNPEHPIWRYEVINPSLK